jgi:hypothetical protein
VRLVVIRDLKSVALILCYGSRLIIFVELHSLQGSSTGILSHVTCCERGGLVLRRLLTSVFGFQASTINVRAGGSKRECDELEDWYALQLNRPTFESSLWFDSWVLVTKTGRR